MTADQPPTHQASEEETVLVELSREKAEALDTQLGIDLEIKREGDTRTRTDQPQAITETLDEALEIIQDDEKKQIIARCENHYVKHFLAIKCLQRPATTTVGGYASNLNEYVSLVPFDDKRSFLETDRPDFRKYISHLVQENNRWKTFNAKVRLVKRLHTHIEAEFSDTPTLSLAFLRRFDPEKYKAELPDPLERKPLTRKEMRELVDGAKSTRDRLIIRLIYQTAIRNTDLRELKLDNIYSNVNNPYIEIVNSKFGKSRIVPVLQELMLDLEHWINVERPAFSPYAPESEYLFPSKKGVKLETVNGLRQIVHNAADRAEIQEPLKTRSDGATNYRVDVHVLRHTANTHWKRADLEVEMRSSILGHEDEDTTRKFYDPDDGVPEFREFRSSFDPVV